MHTACAGLQPITSSTRASKYFVTGCCFCRKHVRICPGEGNAFFICIPFKKGAAKWLLQDYRTSFNGRGGKKGSCINPDLYLKSLQEAAKLFSIQDDAIGNQIRALFSLHSSYQWQKVGFALVET